MSATTVYLVSDGEYSEYRVEGVYSTKEKAEYAKKLFAASNDIEEFTLDDLPEHPPGLFYWSVWMKENGDVTEVEKTNPVNAEEWMEWMPVFDGMVRFCQWAEDEKHAIKIANEKRTQLIASGEWTTDWQVWDRRKALKSGE